MIAVVLSGLIASAYGFHAAAPVRARAGAIVMKDMSKALPFLARPEKLDGSSPVRNIFSCN